MVSDEKFQTFLVSSDPQQSEEDPGPGSERGGAVSDAPTAVVGDSNEEDQGAVTSPSPPREEPRPPGELPIMDPPVRIPKKRTSGNNNNNNNLFLICRILH